MVRQIGLPHAWCARIRRKGRAHNGACPFHVSRRFRRLFDLFGPFSTFLEVSGTLSLVEHELHQDFVNAILSPVAGIEQAIDGKVVNLAHNASGGLENLA